MLLSQALQDRTFLFFERSLVELGLLKDASEYLVRPDDESPTLLVCDPRLKPLPPAFQVFIHALVLEPAENAFYHPGCYGRAAMTNADFRLDYVALA